MCPFGLYFSNWIEKETNGTISSASSFRLCLMQSSRISSNCESYYSFNEMYSIEWKTVTLLIGIGACFLMLVALTSLFGLFVRYLFNKVVAVLTIIFQLLGVTLVVTGVVLFPAGFAVPQVRSDKLCGSAADKYNIGACNIGWAYIVVIVGAFIALVASCLSCSTLCWRKRDRNANSYIT